MVPSGSIPYDVILGLDFLRNVEICMDNGEIVSVRKAICSDERAVINEGGVFSAYDEEQNDNDKVRYEIVNTCYVEENELDIKRQFKDKLQQIVSEYIPAENVKTPIETKIRLTDDIPVTLRPRRLALKEKDILNKQVEEWLEGDVIRPSVSEWASPVVIVPKKNGKYRVCVDYRRFNKKIVKDRYPMPLIEDRIDELKNARVFSVIDLKNGFLHVPVAEESRHYTSFVTPDGQYEFNRTPFGLCISPMSFLRFIADVFKDLIQRKIVFPYVDDLIIPGIDDVDAFERLRETLNVAAKHGLNINWEKCQFLKTRIEFLGYEIQNGQINPGQNKIKAMQRFPKPTCCKEVQSFLGLSGYFRRFVKNYARITQPLSDLTKRDTKFVWKNEQECAFATLKSILATKPVLRIYDPTAITELHTDASKEGYGAILLQKRVDEKMFHPVYFYSRKTTDTEKRYHSYELEVLAVINAIKKLRVYLFGIKFKLITDCDAFKRTLSKKDLSPKVARWALMLEKFAYEVEHRHGSRLKHVDALSRAPVLVTDDILSATIKAKQQSDQRLRIIRRTLEAGPFDDYILENNVLMK